MDALRHLRALIRETLAGQGMPWGGVREGEGDLRKGDVPDSGMGTRARELGLRAEALNRLAIIGEKMFELNMKLRQLYLDAFDLPWRSEEYNAVLAQIEDIREELDQLEILYATGRAELDKR